MPGKKIGQRIDDLIEDEKYEEAQKLIRKELVKKPDDHWLLTRLGETYYEQRQYKKALNELLASREIVPDCPLTLWHLAGTLDALGYYNGAIDIYTWLLNSKKTSEDDPCWESAEWTDELKTDCVFRLGLSIKHAKKDKMAERYFREYIRLLLAGVRGTYPITDAERHIQELRKPSRRAREQEIQQVLKTLNGNYYQSQPLPKLNQKKINELQQS